MWTKGNTKVGRQIGAATMGNSMEILQKKKKIVLSYDPEIPPLGIYPKELKSRS